MTAMEPREATRFERAAFIIALLAIMIIEAPIGTVLAIIHSRTFLWLVFFGLSGIGLWRLVH